MWSPASTTGQGYPCDDPVSTRKDPMWSWSDEPLRVLNCPNATYKVRLIPDVARTEQLR